MRYKHLTLNERNKIELLNKEGYSSKRISMILGFNHSSISRELKNVWKWVWSWLCPKR